MLWFYKVLILRQYGPLLRGILRTTVIEKPTQGQAFIGGGKTTDGVY